jgi:hypothetical protein
MRLRRRGCSRGLDRRDCPAAGPPVGPVVGASIVAAAAARVTAAAAGGAVRDDLTVVVATL